MPTSVLPTYNPKGLRLSRLAKRGVLKQMARIQHLPWRSASPKLARPCQKTTKIEDVQQEDTEGVPPHTRLPVEIMVTIFVFFYENLRHESLFPASPCCSRDLSQSHQTLRRLRLVCRAWRAIIDCAPNFSTYCSLYIPDSSPAHPTASLAVAQNAVPSATAWLSKHDGPLPLDIRVVIEATQNIDLHPVCVFLDSVATRSRSLTCRCTSKCMGTVLKNFPDMPRLETLHLDIAGWYRSGTGFPQIPSLASSPHLAHVSLGHALVSPTALEHLELPYTQLTQLSLTSSYLLSPESLRDVMLLCVNLKSCLIKYVRGWMTPRAYTRHAGQSSASPIVHRFLEHLELVSCHQSSLVPLLNDLHTPALRHLEINGYPTTSSDTRDKRWIRYESITQILTQFHTKAPFPLESLALLNAGRICPNEFTALADAVQGTLKSLTLHSCWNPGEIIPLLTVPQQSPLPVPPKLPELSKLVLLRHASYFPISVSLVADFINSRLWEAESPLCKTYGSPKLKTVLVPMAWWDKVKIKRKLKMWRERGCDVRFTSLYELIG